MTNFEIIPRTGNTSATRAVATIPKPLRSAQSAIRNCGDTIASGLSRAWEWTVSAINSETLEEFVRNGDHFKIGLFLLTVISVALLNPVLAAVVGMGLLVIYQTYRTIQSESKEPQLSQGNPILRVKVKSGDDSALDDRVSLDFDDCDDRLSDNSYTRAYCSLRNRPLSKLGSVNSLVLLSRFPFFSKGVIYVYMTPFEKRGNRPK